MLEEKMEKKNTVIVGRQAPVAAARTPNSDSSKGKQDVATTAKYPRSSGGASGRRREGSVPRADQPPKSWLQKQNVSDKRFQTRVYSDRNGSRVVNTQDAEVGSAFRPGSKKQNLSHLLNFNYGSHRDDGRLSSHDPGNRGYNMWATRKPKYNKELFLQANCQFVVQEGHDYLVYSVDPDLLVDWNWIEQVHVYNHEMPSCPICLYPPVAAKMTRCGHIYCWPCILHYLALSDKTWRKCPICYDAVHKTDLKSISAFETPCFNVGGEIKMKLMYRERNCVIALPWERGAKAVCGGGGGQPFLLSDRVNARYAKLLTATKEQVLTGILAREESELLEALDASSHCPEVCFVEAAILLLAERKALLIGTTDGKPLENGCADNDQTDAVGILEEVPTEPIISTKPAAESIVHAPVADVAKYLDELELQDTSEADSFLVDGAPQKNHYFYQASDGQHIYLHTLNVHMLISEYGALELCPDTITARIVEKEDMTMNAELRRRLRCLGHLPLTCEFELVELHLDVPLVSQNTIDKFEGLVERRRRRRNRRARDDNRRERNYRAEERRRMGQGNPGAQFHLEDNLQQFPEWSSPSNIDDGGLTGDQVGVDDALSISPTGSTPSTTPGTYGSPDDWGCGGRPFAQMLRNGKVQPQRTPNRGQLDETPTTKLRGVSGRYCSDSDSGEEFHAPAYRDSFSAAVQMALDRSIAEAAARTDAGAEPRAGGNRKKKGKQKRLLFTTSVIRNK